MLRMYAEEGFDDDYWNDYERFNMDRDLKLKDLNVKNERHIELIKGTWTKHRSKHLTFIDSNPFNPFKYAM